MDPNPLYLDADPAFTIIINLGKIGSDFSYLYLDADPNVRGHVDLDGYGWEIKPWQLT